MTQRDSRYPSGVVWVALRVVQRRGDPRADAHAPRHDGRLLVVLIMASWLSKVTLKHWDVASASACRPSTSSAPRPFATVSLSPMRSHLPSGPRRTRAPLRFKWDVRGGFTSETRRVGASPSAVLFAPKRVLSSAAATCQSASSSALRSWLFHPASSSASSASKRRSSAQPASPRAAPGIASNVFRATLT